MRETCIDFDTISRALSYSIEMLQGDEQAQDPALERLTDAQEELKRALSYSLSHRQQML